MQNNESNSDKINLKTIEESTLITMSISMSGAFFVVTRARYKIKWQGIAQKKGFTREK